MERDPATYGNLGLDRRRVSVHCVGVGGATARLGAKCLFQQLELVLNLQPSVVFVHVGENDLRALGSGHPSGISSEIIKLAQLISQQVPCVYVSQLLPFPANEAHREAVIWINSALQSAFQSSASVQYWKHRGGFWKPPTAGPSETPLRQIFAEDNVHLSKEGHVVYWHSLRVAITKALQSQNLM